MESIKISENLYPYFEKTGKLLCYEPGETIYFQGDSAEHLFFVKSGRVRAFYLTRSGKELTFEIVEKGRIIGESSFLSQSVYPVSVA
ncbi:MAG TPA: cyclic nucleotide-binding domain-containing protein, partial [Candidatus Blautia pullicola]|nr:cyclic nucleotide-binding domain-containing protein [Candidatus Blautia pullicola]